MAAINSRFAEKAQGGFTILEVVVAIALTALIAAWAVSNLRPIVLNFSLKSNAENILNGLHLARAEAIKRNANVDLVLSTSPLSWSVSCTTVVGNCPNDIHKYVAPSATVTVTTSGGTTATFNNLGRLAAGITQVDIENDPARKMRILVKSNGQAKLCYPDVSTTTDPQYCS